LGKPAEGNFRRLFLWMKVFWFFFAKKNESASFGKKKQKHPFTSVNAGTAQ
jgi:hypothetical protein